MSKKMFAKSAPTATDIERSQELIWKTMCDTLAESNAVFLITVARHFGLGKRRMTAFLETESKVRREFSEYREDGIFREKVEEGLAEIGIEVENIWELEETFQEFDRRRKKQKKNKVASVAEAYKMQKTLAAMKKLQEEKR